MKLLQTQEQEKLQGLLEHLGTTLENVDVQTMSQIKFWSIDLKPKRVRKPKVVLDTPVEI